MKFKEQFPSLEWFNHHKMVCASHIITGDKQGALSDLTSMKRDIEEHCLDKKKVKEVIDNNLKIHLGFSSEVSIHLHNFVCVIKKQMGLE